MKSKFGFIPIVLPVLVMVLIIGLINIGSAPWVQADHDAENEHVHNIGSTHPQLASLAVAASTTEATPQTLTPGFSVEVSSYKVSATYDVEAITLTATAGTNASTADGDRSYRIKRPGQRVLEGTEATIPSFDIPVGTTMVEIKVITSGADEVTSPHTTYTLAITRELPQFETLVLNQSRDTTTDVAAVVALEDFLEGESSLMGNDASLRDTRVDVKVKYHVDEIGLSLTLPAGLRAT